jgi:uncharacterized protein (TIGR02145 family)
VLAYQHGDELETIGNKIQYAGIIEAVQIGSQCWMAENLNIGTKIPGTTEMENNSILEKYCFNNSESNCDVYGGLYKWDEMMQYSITPGVQGLCPAGWHLPADAEWTMLTEFLGPTNIVGGKMKATGTIEAGTGLWYAPNGGATNSSGFTALPAGYRNNDGTFYAQGSYTLLWSSTESQDIAAWSRGLYNDGPPVYSGGYYKYLGFSVRCVNDTPMPVWSCGQPLPDTRDGKTYSTVQIGTQCWMSENLSIGTMIPGTTLMANNSIIEKYCYDNNTAYCDVYGGLYQWNEMMQYPNTPGVQGLCPANWHLPTDAEWTDLTTFLGGQSVAGANMKEVGTTHWTSPNTGANNSSGFTGLPGGNRLTDGAFGYIGTNGSFWSSTADSVGYAWFRDLYYDGPYASRGSVAKGYGFSVRCVQGEYINQAPSIPSAPQPSDGAMNQPVNTMLSWTCTDPENDVLTYDVYFGTTNPPAQVSTGQSGETFDPGVLGFSTSYYWKIVAHDNYVDDYVNKTEGPVWSFTTTAPPTFNCGNPLLDTRDNQTYNTVQIGTQCWMAENLNIGTMIPGYTNMENNSIIEKYCFNDDPDNCDTYGGLYQWSEMMEYGTTPGEQGICPAGWHLPADTEWTLLTAFLGGESIAGGKMKTTGTTIDGTGLWADPNTGATNSSGFSALPGGTRYYGGYFYGVNYGAYFWSSTESSSYYPWRQVLYYNSAEAISGSDYQSNGFSVRCVREIPPAWSCGQPFPDTRDNQTYNTVQIGTQCWMAENLNIGTMVTGSTEMADNSILEKYCFNDQAANCNTYGGLYQWNELMQYSTTPGEQGLCPAGWHLPADEEWTVLTDYLGGEVSAGGKMKTTGTIEAGTGLWYAPNGGATNESGFTSLPAGIRSYYGYFYYQGYYAFFWSSTAVDEYYTLLRQMDYYNDGLTRSAENKGNGFSVRCVREIPPPAWSCGDPLPDTRDNQTYNTVQIGTQCWMAENLNIGTMIPGTTEMENNSIIEKYCYDNNTTNCDTYGGLYKWDEMMEYSTTPGEQGICPAGWHLPSDAEWTLLTTFLGGESIAGGKMKSTTGLWYSPNTGATNESGFTAQPGGFRYYNGGFESKGYNAYFWSTTEYFGSSAWYWYLGHYFADVIFDMDGKTTGYSVRCVREIPPPAWSCGNPMTDTRDNQTYNTVQIDTQCWMAQNLNIGTMIPKHINMSNNAVIEKYCYDNLTSICNSYGGLYQWNEMMQYVNTPGVQGLCPTGWHLPTDVEYTSLTDYLGGTNVAGGKMKESGTNNWYLPNTDATNESGFTALPGGYRDDNGNNFLVASISYFWSSTENGPSQGWFRGLYYNSGVQGRSYYNKTSGVSVRCLKD